MGEGDDGLLGEIAFFEDLYVGFHCRCKSWILVWVVIMGLVGLLQVGLFFLSFISRSYILILRIICYGRDRFEARASGRGAGSA